jgi:beta-glucosidase
VEGGKWKADANGGGTVTVDVTNTGSRQGAETVQLYIRNLQDPEGPLKSLRAFQRVTLSPGQTKTVSLSLDRKSFEFWDEETNTMRTKAGQYELLYGTSSADDDLRKLTVTIQ